VVRGRNYDDEGIYRPLRGGNRERREGKNSKSEFQEEYNLTGANETKHKSQNDEPSNKDQKRNPRKGGDVGRRRIVNAKERDGETGRPGKEVPRHPVGPKEPKTKYSVKKGRIPAEVCRSTAGKKLKGIVNKIVKANLTWPLERGE